jgi:hypothetical protein
LQLSQQLSQQSRTKLAEEKKFSPLRTQPIINPKNLTNEELEFVIKTGKVPPKYALPSMPNKLHEHLVTSTNTIQVADRNRHSELA